MADETIAIVVDGFDPATGQRQTVMELELGPFDGLAQKVPAARYAISFTWQGGGAAPVSCVLVVTDGANIEFTVFPEVVTVIDETRPANTVADLIVGTSPVCDG